MADLAIVASNPILLVLASLAAIASGASLMIGLVKYFREADDRRKTRHYQAWQVINSATGKGGSGGRLDALQDLVRDQASIVGIDLSGAWLRGVYLPHANIRHSALRGTILSEADMQWSRFNGCDAMKANFRISRLTGATFADANLSGVDFSGAVLEKARFDGAIVVGAEFVGATLNESSFYRVDLRNVRLRSVRGWQSIKNISGTNIWGVRDAPDDFRSWALSNGAVEIEDNDQWEQAKERYPRGPQDSPDKP